MKAVIKILMISVCSFFLIVASTAAEVPFGDGGAALQGVLDDITTAPAAGDSSVDVTTDEVPDADDSCWATGASGGVIAMVSENSDLADSNEFGIFDASNPANRVALFGGNATTGSQVSFIFTMEGYVYVNHENTGIQFAGNAFGFYLLSNGNIWHSATSLNVDNIDHMAAYQGTNTDTVQIPPWDPGLWTEFEHILAFEDGEGVSADRDYDDMVVMIENIIPGEPCEDDVTGCRFTGGGVDTDGNWDHTLEDGEMIRNGVGNLPPGIDRYQFGGQAGANTGQQPQPKGEWTHHQQTGPSGDFTFHGGTASAPAGTEIDDIRCSDPGFCFPARPAPAKQLDFDGVGTFKSIGKGNKAPTWEIPSANVTAEGKGNKTFDGTFHWFEVNIDDLGEPGRKNDGAPYPDICPSSGFGEKGAVELADCDCPDYYRITIYDDVNAADVVFLPDGSIDPNSLNQTNVLYEAYGYIDGGNLQIHPPTGFDLN